MEKVGANSTDAYNLNTENLFSKIEWLKQNEESRVIQLQKPLTNDGFILANLEAAGFYRINYDAQSWTNIVQQINSNKNVCSSYLLCLTYLVKLFL